MKRSGEESNYNNGGKDKQRYINMRKKQKKNNKIFIISLKRILPGKTKYKDIAWPISCRAAELEVAATPNKGRRTVTMGKTVQSTTHNIDATLEICCIFSSNVFFGTLLLIGSLLPPLLLFSFCWGTPCITAPNFTMEES